MEPTYLRTKHEAGLAYEPYVKLGTPQQQENWAKFYKEQAKLTPAQQKLISGFTRKINAVVLSGVWCGDCVQQCPLLARIAEANPKCIDLRFLERDQHKDLQQHLRINAGDRVPVALLLAEDCEFVALVGDRTLSRYRAIAKRQLGPSCPLPGAPVDQDEVAATMQDWVNEFERVHLLLRLSARFRQKYGD